MIKSDTIKNIAVALLEAQKAMGNAVKDSKNPFFKSTYADLNAVREAVTPALHAANITILQPTVFIDGRSFVETTLLHSSGEYIGSVTEIVVKDTTNAQNLGSSISYARRYGLQSLLSVGAQDDDAELSVGRAHSQPKHAIASVKTNVTSGTTVQAVPLDIQTGSPVVTTPTPKPAFGGGARSPFRKA